MQFSGSLLLCHQLRVDKVEAGGKEIVGVATEVIKHHELQVV
jgi:hypothetical protein